MGVLCFSEGLMNLLKTTTKQCSNDDRVKGPEATPKLIRLWLPLKISSYQGVPYLMAALYHHIVRHVYTETICTLPYLACSQLCLGPIKDDHHKHDVDLRETVFEWKHILKVLKNIRKDSIRDNKINLYNYYNKISHARTVWLQNGQVGGDWKKTRMWSKHPWETATGGWR